MLSPLLCLARYPDLHRDGDELAFWADARIDPMPVAARLWEGRGQEA